MTISDEESAERVVAAMVAVYRELDGSVGFVQGRLAEDEFFAYRRAVGTVLGECWFVLRDLLEQHPHLRRPGLMDGREE